MAGRKNWKSKLKKPLTANINGKSGRFVRGRRGIQNTRPLELPESLRGLVKKR